MCMDALQIEQAAAHVKAEEALAAREAKLTTQEETLKQFQ